MYKEEEEEVEGRWEVEGRGLYVVVGRGVEVE